MNPLSESADLRLSCDSQKSPWNRCSTNESGEGVKEPSTRAMGLDWQKNLVRDPLDLRDATPEFIERFWSKVKIGPPSECWPWLASTKGALGYGQFYIRKGVPVTASRVALALQGYVLTRYDFACHRCDNPPCVNPSHLFVGTASDNTTDCIQKGRGNRSRGVQHRDSRLTEEIVRNLRRDAPYEPGSYTLLGRYYGCSSNAIRRAVCGITWRHVATEADK